MNKAASIGAAFSIPEDLVKLVYLAHMEEYSVSEFIALLNRSLEALPARVVGEISELKMAASGHAYFTLKDKETGFILPATIWARDYALSGVELEIGMEVAATGRANFYGPFGKLSFNAKTVELVGEGALKKAYELLKKKLTAEGLFAVERKCALPPFVRRIGVVTSVHGAVIHDFSSNLGRYGFQVRILDSKVEGPESGRALALSVRAMREEDIDVLVIIRGGGSIQSLAGFDNEALVREIANFPVPVLAGVGHHQDVTLAALAADFAESTPSFVAALINRSWQEAEAALKRSEERVWNGFQWTLERTRALLSTDMSKGIFGLMTGRIEALKTMLESTARLISQNDPRRQLRLGYSIVYGEGKVVRSIQDAPHGTKLDIHLADGNIQAESI